MERGYWLPPRAKYLAAYAGFYIDSETVYQANMDSGWNRLLVFQQPAVDIEGPFSLAGLFDHHGHKH